MEGEIGWNLCIRVLSRLPFGLDIHHNNAIANPLNPQRCTAFEFPYAAHVAAWI
jgi:hypothetical protein